VPVRVIEAVESSQLTATLKCEDAVSPVVWSPDGKTLASVCSGLKISLWDVAKRKERALLESDLGRICSVAFAPDGKTLAVGHYNNDAKTGPSGGISLWDVANGQGKDVIQATFQTGVSRLAFSPDGKTLAAVERSKVEFKEGMYTRIALRNVADGKIKWAMDDDYGIGLTFSPDGKTVIASTMLYEGNKWLGSKVRRWDAATGKELSSLSNPASKNPCNALAFAPDGRTLAGADCEGNITLWDPASANVRATIKQENKRRITSLAFAPDGKTLAAAIADPPGRDHEPGLVVLFDAASGKRRLTLTGHTNAVLSVAFSPDGKLLASGSLDRTVRLWDVTAEAATGQ
jgi:WD40 repeat protein